MTDETNSGNAAATEGPPPAAVDVQDPLPESNFLWRRVFAYATSTAILCLLAYVIFKMTEAASLRIAALYLSLLLWFSITYYMLAPSAEQVVRIIQAGRAMRSGVSFDRSASSTGEKIEVRTTAGKGGYRPRQDTPLGSPPRSGSAVRPPPDDDYAPSNRPRRPRR